MSFCSDPLTSSCLRTGSHLRVRGHLFLDKPPWVPAAPPRLRLDMEQGLVGLWSIKLPAQAGSWRSGPNADWMNYTVSNFTLDNQHSQRKKRFNGFLSLLSIFFFFYKLQRWSECENEVITSYFLQLNRDRAGKDFRYTYWATPKKIWYEKQQSARETSGLSNQTAKLLAFYFVHILRHWYGGWESPFPLSQPLLTPCPLMTAPVRPEPRTAHWRRNTVCSGCDYSLTYKISFDPCFISEGRFIWQALELSNDDTNALGNASHKRQRSMTSTHFVEQISFGAGWVCWFV